MSWDFLRGLYGEVDEERTDQPRRPAPGKVSLTSHIKPVQRRAAIASWTSKPDGQESLAQPVQRRAAHVSGIDDPFALHLTAEHGTESRDAVHSAAARGVATSAQPLPHLELIQNSFGHHDVTHVQAHVGSAAADASAAMGAEAYATGNHVAFHGTPSLHTAAHEAAHVVQQRAGVHLKGGVGEEGDAYERHADAVADRVVRGQSAVDLLDQFGGASRASSSVTGPVQRKSKAKGAKSDDGGPTLDPDFERMLLEVLDRPVQRGDQDAADERYIEFQGLILEIEEETAAALYARLSLDPAPAKDRLAKGFHRFSTKNRKFILDRLRGSAEAFRPVRAGDQPGDRDMWKELAPGETTKAVHFLGRIDAPKGVHLREHPSGAQGTLLPFDTMVSVERETQRGWYYVVALGDAANGGSVTGSGFIESQFVAKDPPEPTAHLYMVKPGDMLKDIAAKYYRHGFSWGNDARVYVQAIYHANKGRDAVFRQNADLTVDRTALETNNLQKALELWGEARVVSGQALWIPSGEFVAQLKASGVINAASISQEIIKDMWDSTVGAVQDAIDWAQYSAGFVIGLLEGAYGALKDLFLGVADLVKMIWTVVKDIFSGFSELRELAKKLSAAWKNRKDIMADVATDFMKKWENPADYDRGNFQGEFLGYVMMLAFITLVTLGEGTVIAGAGRFGSFIKVIQVADAAGDIGTYARRLKRMVKLPANAVDEVTEALAGRARKRVDVDADDTKARHGAAKPDADQPRTVTVHGAGQAPKTQPWRVNANGVVRSPQEAIDIARQHGVEIPDDIQFFFREAKTLPADTFAEYMSRRYSPGQLVRWEDFYNQYDNIAVKVSKEVLSSDEAIVSIVAHEMHELNGLRRLFDESGGAMTSDRLGRLINPGIKGNLHDHAWDVADDLVRKMRKADGVP